MMAQQQQACRLSALLGMVTEDLCNDLRLRNVWVVGETSYVLVAGGHCYLELIEKTDDGRQLAKVRCTIWQNVYRALAARFYADTGEQFRADIKVMLCVTVQFHQLYGMSLTVTDINTAYTVGDALQRRKEMIDLLTKEGIIDMNRTLPWPRVPQRIAVISAKNAAGYGDFVNQLYSNTMRLRFHTELFEATMQGERTSPTIINALECVAADIDQWDCVVIIRGGGSTSDLAAFDDYALASNIAQFPIPVIIGIGHERDITLLDYVANMRVKTPTAAAEWLIERGEQALGQLQAIAQAMLQTVSDRMSGCHRQLAYIEGQLPLMARNALLQAQKRLTNAQNALASISDRRLRPEHARLEGIRAQLAQLAQFAVTRQRQKLDAAETLLHAISPEATLKRGYTITRVAGHAVGKASDLRKGEVIETIFADGEAFSQII